MTRCLVRIRTSRFVESCVNKRGQVRLWRLNSSNPAEGQPGPRLRAVFAPRHAPSIAAVRGSGRIYGLVQVESEYTQHCTPP
jgi:hypothetical protein